MLQMDLQESNNSDSSLEYHMRAGAFEGNDERLCHGVVITSQERDGDLIAHYVFARGQSCRCSWGRRQSDSCVATVLHAVL